MISILNRIVWLIAVLVFLPLYSSTASETIKLDQIRLPAGFHIRLYAQNLPNARSLALSPGGILFVGTRKAWGRPVDILIMKDGAMLVSDDRAGAIYRITYGE